MPEGDDRRQIMAKRRSLVLSALPLIATVFVQRGRAGRGYDRCSVAGTLATRHARARSVSDPQGYVTSDSGAVQDIYEAHRYANATRAVAEAVKAGCDLNSGGWSGDHAWSTSSPYMRHLPQALEEGLVRAADVDRALATLLRMRFRLGLFDPIERQPYWHVAPEVVRSPEHTAAALDATLQSLVLLRNRARVLPLRAPGSSHGRGTAVRSVAVIGPHARAGRALIGNYYGEVCPGETFDCVQTPYDAVRQHMAGRGTVAYAPGLASVSDTSRRQFAHALATAQACDVVVLLLGLDDTIEAEALDRHSVTLPGAQLELARLLISASGMPSSDAYPISLTTSPRSHHATPPVVPFMRPTQRTKGEQMTNHNPSSSSSIEQGACHNTTLEYAHTKQQLPRRTDQQSCNSHNHQHGPEKQDHPHSIQAQYRPPKTA